MIHHMSSLSTADTELRGTGVLGMSWGPGSAVWALVLQAVGANMVRGLTLIAVMFGPGRDKHRLKRLI